LSDSYSELIKAIQENCLATREEAVKYLQLKFPDYKENVLELVLKLENDGKIVFDKPIVKSFSSIKEYFFCDRMRWFWFVFYLAVSSTFFVFLVPENGFFLYVKYLFGSVLVLFLPGFSLIKLLSNTKKFDIVELIALSVGLSLPIVGLIGLLLNYTPWGIRVIPITFCVFGLILVLAFTAVFRDFSAQKNVF